MNCVTIETEIRTVGNFFYADHLHIAIEQKTHQSSKSAPPHASHNSIMFPTSVNSLSNVPPHAVRPVKDEVNVFEESWKQHNFNTYQQLYPQQVGLDGESNSVVIVPRSPSGNSNGICDAQYERHIQPQARHLYTRCGIARSSPAITSCT